MVKINASFETSIEHLETIYQQELDNAIGNLIIPPTNPKLTHVGRLTMSAPRTSFFLSSAKHQETLHDQRQTQHINRTRLNNWKLMSMSSIYFLRLTKNKNFNSPAATPASPTQQSRPPLHPRHQHAPMGNFQSETNLVGMGDTPPPKKK